MGKNFTAIGNVSGSESMEKTMDPKEARDFLMGLLETHIAGSTLTSEEAGQVVAALASLGSDEVSVSDDGALQGRSTIEYTAEGAGIEVKVISGIGCKGVLDRCRMEWACNMGVQKTAGDEGAYELKYDFRFASFGTNAAGESVILYNYAYNKNFRSDHVTDAFSKGKQVNASQFDFATHQQWGYFLNATCAIVTSEGTLTV